MKQKLLTQLVVGALSGAALVGSIQAGEIASSSIAVAREAIQSNAQAIFSPIVSYRFIGEINAVDADQVFQLQWKLSGGAVWENEPAPANFIITPQAGIFMGVPGILTQDYTVDTIAIDAADPSILYATFTIKKNPGGASGGNEWGSTGIATTTRATRLGQATFDLNVAGASAGTRGTISNLLSLVKDQATELAADPTNRALCLGLKDLFVSVKHYTGLSAPNSLATDSNAHPDEHLTGRNEQVLINFTNNLLVEVTASGGNAKLAVGGLVFTGTNGPSWTGDDTRVNLGRVNLKQQTAAGYDSDTTNKYLLAALATSNIDNKATAAAQDGTVEAQRLDVVVRASAGFQEGSTLHLNTNANCGAASIISGSQQTITSANATSDITLTVNDTAIKSKDSSGVFGATGETPVHVCYVASSATTAPAIPASAFSVPVATLVKSAPATNFGEQNNACFGPLYALGGGLKIDVRNYASSAVQAASGWYSTIRLINNSESRTATVNGQIIQANGQYGPSGVLAILPPRAVVNLPASEVDARLVTPPAALIASDNGASTTATAGVLGSGIAGDAQAAPRLRITSDNTNTLRVQNLLYNPILNQYLEVSGAQGVDFESNTERAPDDSQLIDQDAQAGINGR